MHAKHSQKEKKKKKIHKHMIRTVINLVSKHKTAQTKLNSLTFHS